MRFQIQASSRTAVSGLPARLLARRELLSTGIRPISNLPASKDEIVWAGGQPGFQNRCPDVSFVRAYELPGIFINYRREDSGGYAQRLFDLISSHFGKSQVFIDIDSIEAGADFDKVIRDRLTQCDAFIALIGRNWVRCTDEQGHRRLEDPRDFVRREIAQALGRSMQVIPVLVGGARMPRPEELPADIRPLALYNAHEIPDRFFRQSVRQLIRLLQASVPHGPWPRALTRRGVVLTAGGAVLLTGGAVLLSVLSEKPALNIARPHSAAGGWPKLEISSAPARPPVIVKVPGKVSEVPSAVPGAWSISKLKVAPDVIGPRQPPHLLWATQITIGDAWGLVGFAPDQTLYIWDQEHSTICAIRNGTEEWAYRAEFFWNLAGITPDGRVWMRGDSTASLYCFNSKGEGGLIAGLHGIPRNLLADSEFSRKPSGICRGGAVQLSPNRDSIPVDGNCKWMVRDDLGRFYGATDRGTVYCFSADGAVLWKYEAGTSIPSEPLFSVGDLVLASGDRLFCMRDGLVRWNIQLAGCEPSFVDKAGTIYLSYSENSETPITAAVDRDGKVIWRLQTAYRGVALDPKGRLYLIGEGSVLCAGV